MQPAPPSCAFPPPAFQFSPLPAQTLVLFSSAGTIELPRKQLAAACKVLCSHPSLELVSVVGLEEEEALGRLHGLAQTGRVRCGVGGAWQRLVWRACM